MRRRSPCGERGLKCVGKRLRERVALSLPVRGAWIEMALPRAARDAGRPSLPVRGAWIEIAASSAVICRTCCRSPCGERGLK